MTRLLRLPAFLLVFCSVWAQAQVDSAALLEKSMVLRQYELSDFGFDTTFYQKPDTALHRVWQYDPVTGASAWAHLGVVGSAARPLLLSTGAFRAFSSGLDAFLLYDFTPENARFWRVNKPLTSFDFSSGGGNNQQAFRLFHTQNIGKTVNIGAEYRLLSSDGWYANEATNNKNFRLFGSMVAPGKRYAAHLQYITNNHTNESNGGIVPGRLLEQGIFVVPLGVPVHLNSASIRSNNRTLWLQQQFRLRGADSSFTGIAAFHSLSYRREYFNFIDPSTNSTGYYPGPRLTPVSGPDSNGFRSLNNSFGLKSLAPFGRLQWQIALHHSLGNVRNGADILYQQLLWTDAKATLKTGNWQFYGQYTQVLYNALQENTRQADFKAGYWFNEHTGLELGVLDQTQNAGIAANQFTGLYQQWNQQLGAMRESAVYAQLHLPLGKVAYRQASIGNWVFWDANGIARQDAGTYQVQQLSYSSSLKWWKFRLDLNHGWQWVENGGALRAPRFFSQDVLSINHRFKAGWELQLGTDFRFHTAYLAPGFRPEIGQFVLQDTLQAGNHPLFDLFAAIKVKRTRVFVKFEHANQGFPGPNFYVVPLYPMYSRAFRFGLTWAFYE